MEAPCAADSADALRARAVSHGGSQPDSMGCTTQPADPKKFVAGVEGTIETPARYHLETIDDEEQGLKLHMYPRNASNLRFL